MVADHHQAARRFEPDRLLQVTQGLGRVPSRPFHLGATAIEGSHAGNGLELFDERISQRGACIMDPGHFDGIIDIRDHDDARVINEMDFAFEEAFVVFRKRQLKSSLA